MMVLLLSFAENYQHEAQKQHSTIFMFPGIYSTKAHPRSLESSTFVTPTSIVISTSAATTCTTLLEDFVEHSLKGSTTTSTAKLTTVEQNGANEHLDRCSLDFPLPNQPQGSDEQDG